MYNSYGQLQYERNSVNEGLYYYYDSLGRMTDVRALYYDVYLNAFYGQSTEHLQYVYNGKNQLSQTSTESTEYSYTYDDFGNVVIIEAGEYILAEYTYAANNGKLSSMEYGNGTVVNYTYDTLDRIDQICYTDTNGNQKTYQYTYTTDGKIHTVEDSSSGVGYMYSYNSDGSMSGYIEYRLDSNENVIGIEYIYNEQSLIEQVNTSFTFATSSGTATDLILSYYEYNDDQSLKQLEIDTAGSNFNTYKIAYSYDKFNRLSSKTATYGSLTYETDYIYRNLNSTRASSQVSTYCTFINNIETSYSYTYDVNGNITQIRDDDDKVTQYKYDDQGQLIREDNPYFNKSYVYTYDNAGNRTSKKTYAYTTGTLGSVTSTDTYTYGDETWGDLLTGVNGSNITYDEIGNPSSNGAYHRYTWQNGRQLAQIFDTSHVYTYSYTYNDEGIRTSKTVNGQKHTYTLNGSQIVSEEWTSGSTTHTLVYLYDESGSPIGLQYRPSTMVKEIFYTYFFEKNMQGDITAVFKENGVKIGYYSYDAWGNVKTTVSSGITALEKNIVQSYNPFRYRGYYYDTESGLYYLQSRYYNPQWGRFLNADGYTSTGTGLLGYNMYAYCNNNPVMYVDPTGEFWLAALIVTAVVALCTVGLTGCTEGYESNESLKGTPADPAPKTKAYDNYDDAISDAINYVYSHSKKERWKVEYAVSVYSYGDYYYIGMYGSGRGNGHRSYAYLPPDEGTLMATIHSHPNHQEQPFKYEDWRNYIGVHQRNIEMYIVDEDSYGNVYVRYLPKNTKKQDEWVRWEGVLH